MKIATQFVGASVGMIGTIALLGGGGSAWRLYHHHQALGQFLVANESVQVIDQMKSSFYADVMQLKDGVLLGADEAARTHPHDDTFLLLLTRLSELRQTPDIAFLQRHYAEFEQLDQALRQVTQQPSTQPRAETQRQFRTINQL